MKKSLFLFTISLNFFFIGFSQQITPLKKGIYKNWDELKSNTPSIPLTYRVNYKKIKTQEQISKAHRIAVLETNKTDSKKIDQVLAFFDGKELFFNKNKTSLTKKPYFTFVEMYNNRYGIYNSLFAISLNKDIGAGDFPMYCKINGLELIDLKLGTTTPIKNKANLKKLISNDKELYQEYKTDKEKNQKMKLYIIEYLLRKDD